MGCLPGQPRARTPGCPILLAFGRVGSFSHSTNTRPGRIISVVRTRGELHHLAVPGGTSHAFCSRIYAHPRRRRIPAPHPLRLRGLRRVENRIATRWIPGSLGIRPPLRREEKSRLGPAFRLRPEDRQCSPRTRPLLIAPAAPFRTALAGQGGFRQSKNCVRRWHGTPLLCNPGFFHSSGPFLIVPEITAPEGGAKLTGMGCPAGPR